MIGGLRERDAASAFRLALLALAAAGGVVTAAELAAARHWNGFVQLIPWIALGLTTAAWALVAVRPARGRIVLARGLGAIVIASALYGLVMHAISNYDTGPLDGTYGPRWDAASAMERIWWAASETVGAAPSLAPAVLAQLALLILLATLRHPAVDPGRP